MTDASDPPPRMLLGIDTGGTFTDFVLWRGGANSALERLKVPSTPDDPAAAILQGIDALGLTADARAGRLRIVHGSTVATNATLEGKGARTVYITNRGFTDVLRIGRQARSALYDLHPVSPIDPVPADLCLGTGGRIGPDGAVIEPLTDADLATLRAEVARLKPAAVAVNLLYSYIDDRAERAIETALSDLALVSRSSFVLPEYKEYERGVATWLNAWLGPVIARYLDRLAAALSPTPIAVMQSSGGVIAAAQASRRAVNLLLSGPAGGLAAARAVAIDTQWDDLLTFDMGGTSTDVALLRGPPRLTDEGRVGPYPVAVPMADIHTIGAGGGSIAFIDSGGMLRVGPQSAGADPGPACYGRGGRAATVTDANVVLGRLPGVALGGVLELNREAATRAIAELAHTLAVSDVDAAQAIVNIANEHMAQALRVISIERGHDPRGFSLLCYGGAGGLHVCALAQALSVERVIVPVHAGVFSALGMLIAQPARALLRTVNASLSEANAGVIEDALRALETTGRGELMAEGHAGAQISCTWSVDLRYRGQSFTLALPWISSDATAAAFHELHESRYGHALGVPVEVVNVRVSVAVDVEPIRPAPLPSPRASAATLAFVAGLGEVPVLARTGLARGARLQGPVIVTEPDATTFVDAGWEGTIDRFGHLVLVLAERPARRAEIT